MICGAAILAGGQALAADATDAGATVGEIVVTGSRIPQQNLSSTSPLTVVTDQEVKFEGATNVETLLGNLPSVVPEFNQGVDNGATGTATVQLRNLTSYRTLVLVNGNRLMPGDPIIPSPDLNNIPAALVDHVEVVTGGASAVYGSDAVAGVVNFIMKKNFEGLRIDAQYGFAIHDNNNTADRAVLDAGNVGRPSNNLFPLPTNKIDAQTASFTAVIGANSPDGKGNVTAYAGYRNIRPLTQDRRDYGACGLSTVPGPTNLYDTHICAGSSNSAYGRFHDFGTADNPDGTNTFVPYTGSMAFNFGPYNYYQQHDELYTAGYFAHYEASPMFDIYSNLMFADDSQVSNAAPSGLFWTNGPIHAINCANPLMSAAQAAVICGPDAPDQAGIAANGISDGLSIAYRMAGAPRITRLDHTAFTMTLGTKGKIFDDAWNYDAHVQFGKTSFREVFTGDYSIKKINQALDVVTGPDGSPVCADPSGGCVPLDIFKGLSVDITPAMLNFIGVTAFKEGRTTESVANFSLTGDLGKYGFKSPYASDGVGVAFGAEYRRDTLDLNVDSSFSGGDLSGSGGVNPPASGHTAVAELFSELRAPLVQDMPFVKLLSFETGYRFSDYDLSGTTSTYKFQAEWAPTSDIRFRGGYNRAVRAPNIVELFSPQVVGLESFDDPCAGSSPSASQAECVLTGVKPFVAGPGQHIGQYGFIPDCAAAQCSALTGSPSGGGLTPEKADTFTAGAVITPRMLPGLSLTVDWFDIKINRPVTTIGGALILSQCEAGVTSYCALIHRAPSGGLFGLTLDQGYVIDLNQNSGEIATRGIDFGGAYRFNLSNVGASGLGSLLFTFNGTYTQKFTTAPTATSGSYDCVGLYGLVCGQPQSKWKHEARLTWNTPWKAQLSVNWRYLSAVKLDANQTSDPFLAVEGPTFNDAIDAKIPAYSYFDLAGTFQVKDGISFRFGINNLFDKDPPVVDANNFGIAGTTGYGNGNTYPGVYDTIGRSVFIGLTADF